MINQISNNSNKNVFAPLQSSGVNYAVTKSFIATQKANNTEETNKKSSNLGYNIAKVALISGLGIFAIMKGMPKGGRHKINKWFRFLDDKTSKLNKDKTKGGFKSFNLLVLKGAKEITKRSKTIFNIAPLKDAIVTHWLEKAPTLKKWSDKVSDLFEKISVKTSKRAYSKSFNKFQTMFADFAAANKKLPKEKAEYANQILGKLKTNVDKGFSETAQNERLIEIKKDMNRIDKEAYKATYGNIKDFSQDAVSGTFISEKLASHAKIKLTNKVNKLKEEISISPNDNYLQTRKMLNNIYDFIDQEEEAPRLIMKDLKKELSSYKKALEHGANAEDTFPKTNVAKKLEELKTYFEKSDKYDKKATKEALNYINNINSTLTDKNKKGQIQELMQIYKDNLPEEDFKKLNKTVNKTLKKWDKAIDMETDKLFDKVRDILIGAAPVDVLGVLSSLGVIGWGLGKADNNDERVSVALKFGIPVIGAVMTTLVCTVGLISAGPSLLIGLVSGAAINKLGMATDNFRKKHQGKAVVKSEESLAEMGLKELKTKSKEFEKKSKANLKLGQNKATFQPTN